MASRVDWHLPIHTGRNRLAKIENNITKTATSLHLTKLLFHSSETGNN